MNFAFNTKTEELGLEKYFKLIIRYFLGRMIEKKIFLFKLTYAECKVFDTEGKSSADITFDGVQYLVTVKVNPKDGLPSILFKFAHEAAHLLLMPITTNPYASFNKSDKSFAVTTITRRVKNVQYGTTFEEVFCNFLAYKAVNSIEGIEFVPSKKLMELIGICEKIVSAFDADDYTMWDEYLPGSDELKNAFLFGVVNGDISLAIYRYDKVLGNGAWKDLMRSVYELASSTSQYEIMKITQKIEEQLMFFQSENIRSIKALTA